MILHLSMRRFLAYPLLLFVIGIFGCAAPPQPVETRSVPQRQTPAQVTLPAMVTPPVAISHSLPEVPPLQAKPLSAPIAAGHIALLLPLKTASFQRAATAIQQGFMAAHALENPPRPEVKLYTTTDTPDDTLATYRIALQAGAIGVVGPLTRNAVAALARSDAVTVPTLALNSTEGDISPQPLLYIFALSIESEARLIARRITTIGKKTIATITSPTALSRRTQAAFNDEWLKLGGNMPYEFSYSSEPARLASLRDQLNKNMPEAVFLALDAQQARIVRAYIDNPSAVFATSQVFAEKPGPQRYLDFNGIRFVDMPWLLDPTRSDLARYPREESSYSMELRRLYAFGMDAARLVQKLLATPGDIQLPLAGASGELKLDAERQFLRTPIEAEFVDGEVALVETSSR